MKSQKRKLERKGGKRIYDKQSSSSMPLEEEDLKERGHFKNLQISPKIMLWVSLALVGVILYIYAPSWHFGFLDYDDQLYVSQNYQVSRGLTWQGSIWAFTTGHAANWHPITWLSHMMDVQIFGMAAGPHHVVNMVFHIANTLLLFWLLLRTTGAWGRSSMVAALFAVHPLHVESVVWIAERKDVLSAFLGIVTLHLYVNYIRRPQLRKMLLVAAVFALGVMAKPMLVTLPFLMILFDLWPLRRMKYQTGQGQTVKRLIGEKIPLFVLAVLSGIATLVAQSRGGAVSGFEAVSLFLRATNAVVSYLIYIVKMLWPSGLIPNYYLRPSPAWLVILSVLILISISLLVMRIGKRYPFVVTGWLWYLVSLLPVIGLIQVGMQARADRYAYIPTIGLFVIAIWGTAELLEGRRYKKPVLEVVACVLIGFLAVAARNQVGYWKNDITLWAHAIQTDPLNSVARANYGLALAARDDLAGAIEQLSESLRAAPLFAEAHNNLGWILHKQGRLSESLPHFYEAIRLKPTLPNAHANLGIVLLDQKKFGEADAQFREALRLNPRNLELLFAIGLALAKQGKNEEALMQYKAALDINPSYADAHRELGNALFGQGKYGEAIEHYRMSLKIQPDSAPAEIHNMLGVALFRQGRLSEALPHYYEAIRIKPNFSDAHANLGIILTAQDKIGEALAQFREALKLNPQDPVILYDLGLALAKQGKNEEALMQYKAALNINPSYADAHRELGNVLFVQEKYGEAVEHYRMSLSIQPDSAKTHNNLGLALMQLNRREEAIMHFNEALQIDPNCAEAQRNLAKIMHRR
jgi:protein O-mannosyl-transferase